MSANVNAAVKEIITYLKDAKSKRKDRTKLKLDDSGKDLLVFTDKWRNKVQSRFRSSITSVSRKKPTPYLRFRRLARNVFHLIKVCRVIRSNAIKAVCEEDWFIMSDTFADEGDELFDQCDNKRPFVTFVADEKCRNLIQLTFDKTEYSRDNSAGLVKYMKRISSAFFGYPYDVQCRVAKCLVYDRYPPNRVITRRGLNPDGVYVILSGTLIEKLPDKKSLHDIKPGDRIGEEDIICGCPRRTTVVTRTHVEMASIHRMDYRMIINMADDSNDPRYLDICKHDIVFQHFPMKRLYENPGVWTVLSYKFGRLMVKDSNLMEWIYIIRSGEARVIKHLTTGVVHLDQRRRRIEEQRANADPYVKTQKMIDFVAERKYLKSCYKLGSYYPPSTVRQVQSAPAGSKRTHHAYTSSFPIIPHSSRHRSKVTTRLDFLAGRTNRQATKKDFAKPLNRAFNNLKEREASCKDTENELHNTNECNKDTPTIEITESYDHETEDINAILRRPSSDIPRKCSSSQYVHTPSHDFSLPAIDKMSSTKSPRQQGEEKKRIARVPPFVQLETLFAGKVFGLRACLEPDERGPSASLVSAGCEVLQINKKFFMKYADEAIFSLINLQTKPYPGEEELLDRLDTNLQWEEFKHATVVDFLKLRGRSVEGYDACNTGGLML